MPLHQQSYPDFHSAYSYFSKDDFLPEPQGYTITVQDDDEDDSYWSSYGQNDDTDQPPISATSKLDSTLSSEDAYWAQYSSVQGSGDSTLPSPRPEKQSFISQSSSHLPQRIIIPSDDFQINRTEPYNPLEPPSPEKLAERLAALSPRPESPSYPDEEDYPNTDSNLPSPHLTHDESTHTHSTGAPASPRQVPDSFVLVDSSQVTVDDMSIIIDSSREHDPRDTLLRENIASLYKLWNLSKPHSVSNDQDKQTFLSTVQDAIERL